MYACFLKTLACKFSERWSLAGDIPDEVSTSMYCRRGPRGYLYLHATRCKRAHHSLLFLQPRHLPPPFWASRTQQYLSDHTGRLKPCLFIVVNLFWNLSQFWIFWYSLSKRNGTGCSKAAKKKANSWNRPPAGKWGTSSNIGKHGIR